MYLEELGTYKQTILSKLRTSIEVQEILLGDNYDEEIVDELLDEHIYPFLYVPDTQTKVKTYVCADVTVPKAQNFSIKNLEIIIYVFCHKSLTKYKKAGSVGTRTDILSDVIDKMLDTSRDFGIGRLKLESVNLFISEKTYYGRILTYSASDFNTNGKLT